MNDLTDSQDDSIAITLTTGEFEWIAAHVSVSEELSAALDQAVIDGDRAVVKMEGADLDELLNSLAEIEDEADGAQMLATCRAITERIESQIPEGFYWPENFEEEEGADIEDHEAMLAMLLMANLPAEIRAQMEQVIGEGGDTPPTDGEMAAAMAPVMEKYKDIPIDEYHGLTLGQFMLLLEAEWSTESSPLQTSSDIAAADLADLDLLHNARVLLDATAAGDIALDDGYLEDGALRAMAPQMRLSDPDLLAEMLTEEDFDSGDLIEVEQLRTVCEAAGLLETSEDDQTLSITDLGQTLRVPEAAGGLYEALFLAHFQLCALDWADPEDAWPSLQLGVGFSIYVFSKTGPEGVTLDHFADTALLPAAHVDQPPPLIEDESPEEQRVGLVHCRIVDPLAAFGLVDVKTVGDPEDPECVELRKTPLFDQLIRFEFPEVEAQ